MAMILARKLLQRRSPQLLRWQSSFPQAAVKNDVASRAAVELELPPFDYAPPPYSGPSGDEILAKRREYLSPSLFHFYKNPLNVVEGKKQYLFDEKGKRYLDAFGGIATVCCGHCHPDVVDAIINQTKRLQHSTVLYLNHAIADFAQALASKLPGNLKSGVHHVVNPDPYRGIFGSDGEKYARDVQDVINFGTSGNVAAFISEAIQGVGGIVELAPGYLPAAYSMVKKAGGLCIADEVQAGFARIGSHFWGFESHGVVPDIVTMAKGIGNGIPLGAVVTTPEIAEVLTRRCYFNTFGGNPVCTAAGLAVLKVIEKEKLQQNALLVGSYLKERLTALKDKYELIGDVRGRGLMLGVELVADRELKTPAKAETLHVMDQMKELGVLIGKGGYYGNVFRITPPLCFTKEDADFLADAMDLTLSRM
nr:alanine--glyoxylate aminotransferase 2 homolog 3, mitochondrial isoform X2 [Arachis hypogaea]